MIINNITIKLSSPPNSKAQYTHVIQQLVIFGWSLSPVVFAASEAWTTLSYKRCGMVALNIVRVAAAVTMCLVKYHVLILCLILVEGYVSSIFCILIGDPEGTI